MSKSRETKGTSKVVKYNRWGYYFLLPFILVYVTFQLVPLFSTFYNSFFENYKDGIIQIGPTFIGFRNFFHTGLA